METELELHLEHDIDTPRGRRRKISSRHAEWAWAKNNPFVLNVYLFADETRETATFYAMPMTSVRYITAPVKRRRVEAPPKGLVLPSRH